MSKITRITLSYSPAEDRIHLALLLEGGRALSMWLTQRLGRLLASALVTLLERAQKATAAREARAAAVRGDDEVIVPQVVAEALAQDQALAVATIKPEEHTIPDADSPVWLITDIKMTLGRRHVQLQLVSSLDVMPSAILDETAVRQWLSLLHKQFVHAGWPLDIWPQWLQRGDTMVPQGATQH